jgi:hypothetical protein
MRRVVFFEMQSSLLFLVSLTLLAFQEKNPAQAFAVSSIVCNSGTRKQQGWVGSSLTRDRRPLLSVGGKTAARTSHASALKVSGGDEEVEVHKKGMIWRELIAEYMGTFLIVWLGCGTVCSAIYTGAQTGLWQIAVVWSIAVTVAISCTSAISGAHLNPAISIAIASLRRGPSFGWGKVLPYCAAQLLGAISAASVNFILYREKIAAFEASSGIVRGAANSVASASAFGEYWR